jgi:hypothetical protein
MKKFQWIKILMLGILLAGCSGGGGDDSDGCNCDYDPIAEGSGLAINFERQNEKGPANVSVMFKVDTYSGTPLTSLTIDNFQIFEDGSPISVFESQPAIIPKPGTFESHTLLLLDLSGSVLESENLSVLKSAARNFVNAIMLNSSGESDMGIWWFDGANDLHQLVDFVTDTDRLISGINDLNENISKDDSTNLYGSVISGIDKLRGKVGNGNGNASIASLVIFTDGTDQAARRTQEEALKAVNEADENISVYTVGLGGEIDKPALRAIGKDGFFYADYIEDLVPQFEEIGSKIRRDVNSYYTLEYCSPKRKGSHDLTIAVKYKDDSGTELTGSLKTCFCAEDFTGGCKVSGGTSN